MLVVNFSKIKGWIKMDKIITLLSALLLGWNSSKFILFPVIRQ